jgi:hypothetical protein
MAIADLLNRSFDTTEQFANALVDVIQQVSGGTQPQPQPQPQVQIAPTQPTAIQQIIVDENNSEELANIVEQINSGLRAIEQARILTILS